MASPVRLSFKQSKAVLAAKDGDSVLVCGLAGSGKTFLATSLKRILHATTVSCCPYTAARMGWYTFEQWRSTPDAHASTKALVVDDAYLLTNQDLVDLDESCKTARGCPTKLFGGMVVVLLVDFFQSHVFAKNAFNSNFPVVVHLTEPYGIDPAMKESFVDICFRQKMEPVAVRLATNTIDEAKSSLLFLDAAADVLNLSKLDELSTPKHAFVATTRSTLGTTSEVDAAVEDIDSSLPLVPVLTLREGCRVVLISDYSVDDRLLLHIGSKGTVRGFDMEGMPIVTFDDGPETSIENIMWSIPRYPHVQRLQVPLKLAWAVRTTDMPSFSLDNVVIDTTKIPPIRLYHALTKCKRFEGIKLI